jgi:hypothetical protein
MAGEVDEVESDRMQSILLLCKCDICVSMRRCRHHEALLLAIRQGPQSTIRSQIAAHPSALPAPRDSHGFSIILGAGRATFWVGKLIESFPRQTE